MKPIIGLIARTSTDEDGDKLICMWEKTRLAVVKKGGVPLILTPNQAIVYEDTKPKEAPALTSEEISDIKRLVDMCDAILLPGGYKWFEFDGVVYDYALSKNMPILGICAGMQMMCRYDTDKTDVAEDTTVKNETEINHHQREVKYVHKVSIYPGSKLYKIIGSNLIDVNSKHNYHVDHVRNLLISSYSEDGLIESVEDPNKNFVIGVQWHPETMIDYDENANKIMDKFIEEAENYSRVKKM